MTIPVVLRVDGEFIEQPANQTITNIDGLQEQLVSVLITAAYTDEDRRGYRLYLALDYSPASGYQIIPGTATYAFTDGPTNYIVQQTYSVEVSPTPPLTIAQRVALLEADWAEEGAMRSAIEADVAALQAAMPVKASAAPPAVAAASAKGVVESEFALRDHTHEINGAQNSAISSNQSAISALQTLTGGLNTPGPSNNAGAALAATGAAGAGTTYSRDGHAHPLPIVTPSTGTARVLGTAWTPSTTKAVLVVATVKIVCTATIAGASEGSVEFRSDTATTPTTQRCRVQNRNAVSLAVVLQAVNEQTGTLVHLVPAGEKALLVAAQTGTVTITLERVTETVIG